MIEDVKSVLKDIHEVSIIKYTLKERTKNGDCSLKYNLSLLDLKVVTHSSKR